MGKEVSESLTEIKYDIPKNCSRCEGALHYEGVGEYKCTICGFVEFDDYGKVRNYIEKHPGAKPVDVSAATNVKLQTIRKLVSDGRIDAKSTIKNEFM